MTLAAMIVFFVSLILIIALFTLKKIELRHDARFAENARARADIGALYVKSLLETSEGYIERIPFFIGALVRYGVHVGALSFARLARGLEREAHRVADLVSHKHRFERRETKSKYLKEVSSYKSSSDPDVRV